MEEKTKAALAPTTLAGFRCQRIISSGASWHMLAGYEARKAWRDIECIKNSVEDGRGDGKPLLIFLYAIDKAI